ncbi:MAG: hypothetical protein G01um101429_604 [Parcubacteria group bacterium Gr01-1014_29]|nr:MAG: hypothetical protein G01um101429_604 [Parcubacteria group bacterium Gr01-1014_29]
MPHSSVQFAAVATNRAQQFLVDYFFPFLALISAIVFLWGLITVIMALEDDQKHDGKRLMLFGAIGVLIFILLWSVFYFTTSVGYVPTDPALLRTR